jgi:hypothetical protein
MASAHRKKVAVVGETSASAMNTFEVAIPSEPTAINRRGRLPPRCVPGVETV